jgi:hypothetical protein
MAAASQFSLWHASTSALARQPCLIASAGAWHCSSLPLLWAPQLQHAAATGQSFSSQCTHSPSSVFLVAAFHPNGCSSSLTGAAGWSPQGVDSEEACGCCSQHPTGHGSLAATQGPAGDRGQARFGGALTDQSVMSACMKDTRLANDGSQLCFECRRIHSWQQAQRA